MKESSVTTGEEKKEEQTRLGGEFLVVAAKQKAHSNVDPSLLWYGGQACWSSVCVCACAPVQTSCALAAGYRSEQRWTGCVCLPWKQVGRLHTEVGREGGKEGGRKSRWCGATGSLQAVTQGQVDMTPQLRGYFQ